MKEWGKLASGRISPAMPITFPERPNKGCLVDRKRRCVAVFHATMLRLLGIDHFKLTYKYAGRNFRLTDVHGHLGKKILA